MELAPKRFADAVVVRPAGRVDQSSAEAFQHALVPYLQRCTPEQDQVILDLSGLEYISSAGLRVLMLAGKQCKAQKGTLVLTGLQPLVREIFEISKFTMVFTITPSLGEALAKASPGALAAFEKAA
jgi:anti-anti-sigma factor